MPISDSAKELVGTREQLESLLFSDNFHFSKNQIVKHYIDPFTYYRYWVIFNLENKKVESIELHCNYVCELFTHSQLVADTLRMDTISLAYAKIIKRVFLHNKDLWEYDVTSINLNFDKVNIDEY